MKKIFWLLAVALPMVAVSCSDDDNGNNGNPPENSPTLETSYISVEDGTYYSGTMPSPTTSESLTGVDLSDQVMNGATNFITVSTDQEVVKFFLGVKGVDGYIEYIPTQVRSTNNYVIPLMMAQDYTGDCELALSAELAGGAVTIPGYFPLYQVETKAGALDIKMAFSNEKDVDLHVFTPSGIHIYYSNSEDGYYYGEMPNDDWWDLIGEDEEFYGFEFGLDIDSNAGCSIDGINKENVYIPDQFLENGEYAVYVDLYENCDPSIATSWSITTRMNGVLVTPTEGQNPAYGEFEEGAESSYSDNLVLAMKFNVAGVRSGYSIEDWPKVKLTKQMVKHAESGFYKNEFAKAHRQK